MTAEECDAREFGAIRGCVTALALSAPFWCLLVAALAWVVRR